MQLMKCWEDGCDHLVEVTQAQAAAGRVYCEDHSVWRGGRRLLAMVPAADLEKPSTVQTILEIIRREVGRG